ncbi:MAG TPA: hypothetical protein VLL05_03105 [Terriglobales bacterium]|nr:hypothetical protein [Terriglobales bacterium]
MFDAKKLVSLLAFFLLIGMSLSCGSSYGGSTLTGITIAPNSPSIAVGPPSSLPQPDTTATVQTRT